MVDLKTRISAREKEELEAQKEIQLLEPLQTELIQVNYAIANDFQSLLQSNSKDKTHSFLSERGSVSVDVRTNTLLIQDTSARMLPIFDV